MMPLRNTFAGTLLLLLGMASIAHADSKAKRLIFDDCEETKLAVSKLEAGEIDDFISYLERVLSLPTGSASELLREPELIGLVPATPLQRTGQPALDELKGMSISRTLEPSREIEAKRCAADLLVGFGEKGLRVLPVLLPLLDDSALPDEVRATMKIDVESMVKQGRSSHSQVLVELLPPVFEQIHQSNSSAAKDALVAFGDVAEPFLIQKLFGEDVNGAEIADALLGRIDPAHGTILPLFELTLHQSDRNTQNRALSFVSRWDKVPIQFYDEMLDRVFEDGSPGGDVSVDLLERLLGQEEDSETRFEPQANLLPILLTAAVERDAYSTSGLTLVAALLDLCSESGWRSHLLHRERFRVLLSRVTARAMKAADIRDQISNFLVGLPSELRRIHLPLLAALLPADKENLSLCEDSLRSADEFVRNAAFDCLGNSPQYAEEKLKVLLQFLKSPAEKKDETRRREGVLQALDALRRFPDSSGRKSFLNYASEALSWEPLGPRKVLQIGSGKLISEERGGIAELLWAYPESLASALKKSLLEGSEEQVSRVLSVLSSGPTPSGKVQAALGSLLESARARLSGNPEIQSKITEILSLWSAPPPAEAKDPKQLPSG